MAGTRFQSRIFSILDDNGTIAPGAKVYFYQTGTSTPQATYYDADLDPGHANSNPVVYGADGRQSVDIYLDPGLGAYRVVYKDADGNTLAEDDPVAGNDIADAIAQHNADLGAHVDATESSRGWTRYATDVEAQAMDADDCSLTPANLEAIKASTAQVEAGTEPNRFITPLKLQDAQATAAEVLAGTDTTHFMGPKAFADNIAKSATTLNAKLPGGLTFKIGTASFGDVTPSNHYLDITFPAAFGTDCIGVWPIFLGDGTDASVLAMGAYAIVSKSASACRLYVDEVGDHTQTGTLIWLAIGY